MKKIIYSLAIVSAIAAAACSKSKDSGGSCGLPATAVPQEVTGSWVNGYTSFTQIVDAYNGQYLGSTWQSGRYLHLEADGENAVLYVMGGSQFSEFATKMEGTVEFDEESNFFRFHVCKAHYKGWQNGALTVNRAATASEREDLSENLQFFYDFTTSGGTTYLQLFFDPQGSPTSFRRSE